MPRFRVTRFLKHNRSLLLIIAGLFFFRTAIADWSPVPTSSMEPTIYPGDVVLVNKLALGPAIPFTHSRLFSLGSPERGDIITFYPPNMNDQYVKRVIAVPGDTLRIEGAQVFVNNVAYPLQLDEADRAGTALTGTEYIGALSHQVRLDPERGIRDLRESIRIPAGRYFVMGDFRNNSEDSRYWGLVSEDRIIGKVSHVAVSIARERPLHERIGLKLQ